MMSRQIRHEKVKSFSVLVTFTSFQSKNIDPYVRLIIIMIFPIFITLMVNMLWSPLFQFPTTTRRHLQTALRQLVNSSIAQTSLIRLAANSCCCRAPLSHIRSPLLSRSANGYWSLVVTVIYSGPLSGHKTSPADDNSPDRCLTAAIVLCSIVGTFAPFAAISLFMCPAGRSRVDRVFSLFLALNTWRFIFFFSDCALSFGLNIL